MDHTHTHWVELQCLLGTIYIWLVLPNVCKKLYERKASLWYWITSEMLIVRCEICEWTDNRHISCIVFNVVFTLVISKVRTQQMWSANRCWQKKYFDYWIVYIIIISFKLINQEIINKQFQFYSQGSYDPDKWRV